MAKKNMTIDDLAGMVKKGFDHMSDTLADKESVNKRFDGLEVDIKHLKGETTYLKGEVAHLNASMSMVQRDVAEIRKQFVRRDEFDDLFGRVSYLERRFGIKSGK